jgi:DNA-binding HxlR family transcriptional regulator
MQETKKIKELCPVAVTLESVGGKWKLVILWHLSHGTHRFSELEKKIMGITQKMLAQELREMEKDKLIIRKVYPVVPPKVEYSLSRHGKSLNTVLGALSEWGEKHQHATKQIV